MIAIHHFYTSNKDTPHHYFPPGMDILIPSRLKVTGLRKKTPVKSYVKFECKP